MRTSSRIYWRQQLDANAFQSSHLRAPVKNSHLTKIGVGAIASTRLTYANHLRRNKGSSTVFDALFSLSFGSLYEELDMFLLLLSLISLVVNDTSKASKLVASSDENTCQNTVTPPSKTSNTATSHGRGGQVDYEEILSNCYMLLLQSYGLCSSTRDAISQSIRTCHCTTRHLYYTGCT